MKVFAKKVSGNMLAVELDSIEEFDAIRIGTTVSAEVKKVRNYRFLRKYFALLKLAFDYWEPGDSATNWKGEPIAKNFERFRDDVQIVAGFGEPVWNLRGELRLQSKSISFGKMSEKEFTQVYSSVLTVLLDRVLRAKGFTADAVNLLVDQLTSFA